MYKIINNHDLVHVKWVAWVRNGPEQEAITANGETSVIMRKIIKKEALALQKDTAKIYLIRPFVFIFQHCFPSHIFIISLFTCDGLGKSL